MSLLALNITTPALPELMTGCVAAMIPTVSNEVPKSGRRRRQSYPFHDLRKRTFVSLLDQ